MAKSRSINVHSKREFILQQNWRPRLNFLLLTPPPGSKRKIEDLFLQILNIRCLLFIRIDIRNLKLQFLLHSLDRLHPLLLFLCIFTFQTLPTTLNEAFVVVEVIAWQAEVGIAHLDAFAALRTAEDTIAGCRVIFGLVLEPKWVDVAALAVTFLAAVSAAVYDLGDYARAFAFFALEGLELLLEAHYLASRWLLLIIFGVAFEQIHALLPFALQLEVGDVD